MSDDPRGAPAGPEPAVAEPASPESVPAEPASPEPASPEQSREDTDAAWGEYPETDDDERLYRDRPPHWDDF